MKKLMLAAAAMAIAGSASAVIVYDYRATIKHPYLRTIPVTVDGTRYTVYTKFVSSTTLTGYLIQDDQAVLNGGREVLANVNAGGAAWITGPVTAANGNVAAGNGVAQPENRCFLVAQNRAAGEYTYPRIIPGVLEAKWWNPNFRQAGSVPVQAYLWLGGEVVTATDSAIGITGNDQDGAFRVFGHKGGLATVAPGEWHNILFGTTAIAAQGGAFPIAGNGAAYGNAGVKIADYAWVSEYLFGQFNQRSGVGGHRFADCWLNGAGFGQSGAWDGGYCCGWEIQGAGMSINTLQGNLKGGLALCSVNGENWSHARLPYGRQVNGAQAGRAWSRFDRQLWGDWDEQRAFDAFGNDLGGSAGGDFDRDNANAIGTGNEIGRANFNDLWVDGPLELATTDCASGSFSLRRVTRNMTQDFGTGDAAVFSTAGTLAAWGGIGAVPSAARTAASTADGTLELLRTINGCMLTLNRNARMTGTDAAAAPANALVPSALFGPTFYNHYLAQ